MGKWSGRVLPARAEGLSENAGFFPGVKGSLSNGASERSRGGLVLLSMEGGGSFAVLWFRLRLGSSWLGWGWGSGEWFRPVEVVAGRGGSAAMGLCGGTGGC